MSNFLLLRDKFVATAVNNVTIPFDSVNKKTTSDFVDPLLLNLYTKLFFWKEKNKNEEIKSVKKKLVTKN